MTVTPDQFADRYNAPELREDGKPTVHRSGDGGPGLLLSRHRRGPLWGPSEPVVIARAADPDGHRFDGSPHAVMDRAAVTALAAALVDWLDTTAVEAGGTGIVDAEALGGLIRSNRFTVPAEAHLQKSIGEVLADAGVRHQREVRLSPRDRIDFLTADGVGIEVKVAGKIAAVLAQSARYAASDRVEQLLLVTTRTAHTALPDAVGGKPLVVAFLGGAG